MAGGLLLAFLRTGEEARLESPFSPSPRKSSEFSPPLWSQVPAAVSWLMSMAPGAVLREAGSLILLLLSGDLIAQIVDGIIDTMDVVVLKTIVAGVKLEWGVELIDWAEFGAVTDY